MTWPALGPELATYWIVPLNVPAGEIGAGLAFFCGGGGPPPEQKSGGCGAFSARTFLPVEETLKLIASPPLALILPLYLAPFTCCPPRAGPARASTPTAARTLTWIIRERNRVDVSIPASSLRSKLDPGDA